MRKQKYLLLIAIKGLALALFGCGAEESGGSDGTYPEEDITFIVPSSEGGGFDTTSRQVQPYFEEALGTNLRFENHPGGDTAIGTNMLLQNDSDGYSMMLHSSPHFQFSLLDDNVNYEFEDLYPVGGLTEDPGVIRVREDAPWEDLSELIEYARDNEPGTLTASVSFISSSHYLALKQLEEGAGIEFNIVPFGGGSEARNAVIGGQVDLTHSGAYISQGIAEDSRVLGVQAPENLWKEDTDDTDTFNNQLDFEIEDSFSSFGFYVQAEMIEEYPDRYEKMVDALAEAIENEDYLNALEEVGEINKLRYVAPEELHEINQNILDEVMQYQDLM